MCSRKQRMLKKMALKVGIVKLVEKTPSAIGQMGSVGSSCALS